MISEPIGHLLERLKNKTGVAHSSSGDSLINVHKITEKAGAAYEKLRYLVDYKDERHVRRSAIERIIKRKILLEGGESIGLSLIQELIAGRYLQNNAIPESAALDVDKIIHKYKKIELTLPGSASQDSKFRKTLVSLIGSEIENFFYPNSEDDFVTDAFYHSVKDSIRISPEIPDSALQTQIHIACYRSLLNTDDESLFYKFWLKQLPENWATLEDDAVISKIGEHSVYIWQSISQALENPLSFKLMPRLYNYAIYFSVIREIVRAYGAESERILGDHHELEQFTKEFLKKNYSKQFSKARWSALRAVFFIFITKTMMALALEVPYQIYFLKELEYIPIATNVLFHPLLLLVVTVSVRPLGDKNTKAIISGVDKILKGEEMKPIKIRLKGVGVLNTIFLVLYAVLFVIVFGGIVSALKGFNWSMVSILLFLSFLTLVSYFALRIRHSANKWRVATEDDRVVTLAFNLFALPIVRAGKWLSRKFSSINLFAFILDFIIETPFKLMLHFSDAFVSFLKEKQEDVY